MLQFQLIRTMSYGTMNCLVLAYAYSPPGGGVTSFSTGQKAGVEGILGDMLREAGKNCTYKTTVEIIRMLAMTGCRRSEVVGLMWSEVDWENSCLKLEDSKTGFSIRPVGLSVIEALEGKSKVAEGSYVFEGYGYDNAFGGFVRHWRDLFRGTALSDVTPHVLRHSFASLANDLGLTEITIAALVGHAHGSITSRYIHTIDANLVSAADTMAGFIQGLLEGKVFNRATHTLNRAARKQAINGFLDYAQGNGPGQYEGGPVALPHHNSSQQLNHLRFPAPASLQ